MDWKSLIPREGMFLLGTLTVGFFLAIVLLLSAVIQWSAADLLWFLPVCIVISYGGRIAVWAIKTSTDTTKLTEAIGIIFPSLKPFVALVEGLTTSRDKRLPQDF